VEPRLVLSDSLDLVPTYATLSHCWGDGEIPKLRVNTLIEMQRAILVSRLSRTFREAMETAKQLGFEYIWIDSLCIIQENQADWLIEASRLGTIYQNSGLNIAATRSPGGDEGCFTTRKTWEASPTCVKFSQYTHPVFGTKTHIIKDKSLWEKSVAKSPLLARGW
jgi:hypothetical protein